MFTESSVFFILKKNERGKYFSKQCKQVKCIKNNLCNIYFN